MFSPGLPVSGAIQRNLLGSAGILIPVFGVFLVSLGSLCPAGESVLALSAAELHGWGLS